jgi:hypothetical protein
LYPKGGRQEHISFDIKIFSWPGLLDFFIRLGCLSSQIIFCKRSTVSGAKKRSPVSTQTLAGTFFYDKSGLRSDRVRLLIRDLRFDNLPFGRTQFAPTLWTKSLTVGAQSLRPPIDQVC